METRPNRNSGRLGLVPYCSLVGVHGRATAAAHELLVPSSEGWKHQPCLAQCQPVQSGGLQLGGPTFKEILANSRGEYRSSHSASAWNGVRSPYSGFEV